LGLPLGRGCINWRVIGRLVVHPRVDDLGGRGCPFSRGGRPDLDACGEWDNTRTKGPWEVAIVAASRKVEFGCVVAAAGAPGASDREMYRDMVTDCAQYSELGFGTMWVLEHHFSDYFPAPDPA